MNNAFPPPLPGACALTHWGLIHAQGADAASFLHGQLTNDVANLPAGQARLAGYCSAKGRLLASFVIWREGVDDVFLACHQSLLAATLKRLSMFVLRAKCKLSDASAYRPLWGILGASAAPFLGDTLSWHTKSFPAASLLRLPDVAGQLRALWVGQSAADLPAELPLVPLDTWKALEVASGLPTVEAATADQFVPQMLNFELIGGVNFQKGCYPGQEVVARSQYRASAKRRMFLFQAQGPAAAGTEIFHSADAAQPAGLVVNAVVQPDGLTLLLAEVKLAALAQGTLHLSSITGAALAQRPLPYAIPIETPTPASSGTL